MIESIFKSSLRAFFVSLFAFFGFGIALLLVILLFAGALKEDSTDIETNYSTRIVADEKGIRRSLGSNAPVILQLNIKGIIGTEALNKETISDQLMESREGIFETDRVKAVLLRINSPGGTVIDADGIYRAVKRYKEKYKVPVYAFVDGLCASGGMYIACAADKIYATDVSEIGSIGVITSPFMNYTQLMEKIGVQSKTIFAGKYKDLLNPFRPWEKGETEEVQSLIDYYYAYFMNIVLMNRPQVDKDELVQKIGAMVLPATQAVSAGLADKAGVSVFDTLKDLAKAANLTEDYQVIELENKNWLYAFFKGENSLMSGKITHEISFPDELNPRLMNQFLYLYRMAPAAGE